MYVIEIENAYSFCYSNVVAGLFIQTNVDNNCHQIKKMLKISTLVEISTFRAQI